MLERVDTMVRKEVKESLNLPTATSTDFIYLPLRLGGLGIENLKDHVVLNRIMLTTKLKENTDPTIPALLLKDNRWMNSLEKLQKLTNTVNVVSKKDKTQFLKNRDTERLNRFKHSAQGVGAAMFADSRNNPGGNNWMRGKCEVHEFSDKKFINAIKLRTLQIPTRSVQARMHPSIDTTCRFCGSNVETIAHLTQKCENRQLKRLRIARHDKVKNVIANHLSNKGFITHQEYSFHSHPGMFRPDIVAIKDNVVNVVDVCIPFDDTAGRLEKAVSGKVAYYKTQAARLSELFPGKSVLFHGLAVGARGAWTTANNTVCKHLQMSKHLQALLQRIAIEGSLNILNTAHLSRDIRAVRRPAN